MIGSTIKVVATAESGNKFESDETEEVGVYEALEILSAEQTGANTVKVTFSAPATADDKLAVKKGSIEQSFTDEFDDDTFKSKTLTFKNNLTTGTYTVTLTPEDEEVAPSSVTFEAEAATKANEIEIVGDVLVMKDTNFDEGYCFIKGYNEFGEEISLSGLTVNVAPSDSATFDISTGKVTAKYADPGYAVVRSVSVFAQYTTADGNIITTQKTLDVSTIGYPSEVEFGAIKKEGETGTYDEIQLAELSSNKYYVELNTIKDQYGNDLSADDLNDLVEERLLTVIPSADSPIFFGTNGNPFSEKDGKVVVFLTPNNDKRLPGDGQLMITGAGGSFAQPISIVDDAYVQTLNVEIPDLYEGEISDVFTFSAVDQYGNDVDLYDFVPDSAFETLTFTDRNNLTGKPTEIKAERAGYWKVKKDTVNKTFTVQYTPDAKAKSMVTFTIITAGMETAVRTITVGGKGAAMQIVDPGAAKVGAQNIASYIQFKDANGKTMDRIDDAARYPHFLYKPAITTNTKIKDETIEDNDIFWVVTTDKLLTDSTSGGKNPGVTALPAKAFMDEDGKIEAAAYAVDTANSAGKLYVNGVDNVTPSYYVTLLGTDGTDYRVLDSTAFRFVYVPTSKNNLKYKVNDTSSMLLYAHPDSTDEEEIKVTITNDAGETWTEGADALTPSAPFTSTGNKVYGEIASKIGDGEVSVKVYKDGEARDTVKIAYSDDDPVPTTTAIGLETTDKNNDGTVPEGVDWKPAGRYDLETSDLRKAQVTLDGGVLTITNATVWGDTFTASIKDQYGVVMTNSTVKVDGNALDKADYTALDGELNIVMTNGSQKIDLTVEVGLAGLHTNKPANPVTVTKVSVKDKDALADALKMASATNPVEVTLAESLTPGTDVEVPAYAKLIVPTNVMLNLHDDKLTVAAGGEVEVNGTLVSATEDTSNGDITINGELAINGKWNALKNFKLVGTATGTVTGAGHVTKSGTCDATGFLGKWDVAGNSLEIATGGKLKIGNAGTTPTWGGNIEIDANATLEVVDKAIINGTLNVAGIVDSSTANEVKLANGTEINLENTADVSKMKKVSVAEGASVTVTNPKGEEHTITGPEGGSSNLDINEEVAKDQTPRIEALFAYTSSDINTKWTELTGLTSDGTVSDAGSTGFAAIILGGSTKVNEANATLGVIISNNKGTLYTEVDPAKVGKYQTTNGNGTATMYYFNEEMNGDYSAGVQPGDTIQVVLVEGVNSITRDKETRELSWDATKTLGTKTFNVPASDKS